MADLREELQTINGVGEATADAILDVLDEYGSDDLTGLIEQAYDYHEAGQHEYARKYVRRAYERVND